MNHINRDEEQILARIRQEMKDHLAAEEEFIEDDPYTEAGLEQSLEDDAIDSIGYGVMLGWNRNA